jgi:O-methyltransferase
MSNSLRGVTTKIVQGALGRLGYEVRRVQPPSDDVKSFPPDFDHEVRDLFQRVQPYTLTGMERVLALRDSVRYISRAGIDGDICECGVWRGGSMMVVAITLVELGDTDRNLYMFDTFTRPPDAGPRDGEGDQAALEQDLKNPAYSYLPMDEVRRNLERTGYPPDKLQFVPGLVEETLPERSPERLALLRLDTDYYSSTAHEMTHLYPRINPGGVLIVDDYGDFVGAKAAVDEYFASADEHVLLNRIDSTGRSVIVRPRGAAGRMVSVPSRPDPT